MKKHLFLILVLFAVAAPALAQQRDQSTFDHFNRFNLNNARAGLDSCIHAFAQHKQQWVGVKGAPDNTQLQAHMPIGTDMGVGIEVANWRAGLLSATNVAGTFAKHFNIGAKYRLSAALSLGYYQYSFGADDVVVFDNDNYLNQSRVTSGGVYGDLGFLFTTEKLEVGLSIPSLFSTAPSFDIGSEVNEYNVAPYLNAHAAYSYALNADFELTPMLVYRSIPGNGAIMDVKAGVRYRNMLGVNLGYRTRNGLIAAVDYTFMGRYKIGYAYDAGMSQLNGISGGSHEFLLGFQLCKAKRKPKKAKVVDYYLSGVVSDGATNQGLEGLSVVVKDIANGTSKTVITDSTGSYTVKVDSSAKYEVSTGNEDYARSVKTLTIDPAQSTTSQNLNVKQKQVGAEGRVVDANTTKPIEGAKVTFTHGEEVVTATTDNQGRFTVPLKDLKRGDLLNYTVNLEKDGYEPATTSGEQTLSDYQTIDLSSALKGGLSMTPEKKPEPKVEQIAEIIDLEPINFAVNSAKITPASAIELDKVVKVLTDNPEMKIEVGAHTDCTGSEAGNKSLSAKRANSSMEYIQSRIENPERVTGQGYGESKPLTDCECSDCGKEDHEKNRRTEFRIVD